MTALSSSALEIEYGEFFPAEVVSAWLKTRPEDFAPGFIECWQASGAAQ